MRFCTDVGNMVLCRRDCESYGGYVLIQSRLNNTAGYLRQFVCYGQRRKLLRWLREGSTGLVGVVQYLTLCLDPWDITRILTHHGGQQLSLILTKMNIGTVCDSVCSANLHGSFPVPLTSRA